MKPMKLRPRPIGQGFDPARIRHPHVHTLPRRRPRCWLTAALLVVVTLVVVHPAEHSAAAVPGVAASNATLPRAAAEMRDAILSAVHSGRLDELKTALELNEMRPDLGDGVDDPIAFWRHGSKDGSGREILAALDAALALKPAVVPLGRDIENNAIYVWPYLAERDLSRLSMDEETDLAKLMPASDVAALKAAKRWTWWRLAIGADGTWHSFRREK